VKRGLIALLATCSLLGLFVAGGFLFRHRLPAAEGAFEPRLDDYVGNWIPVDGRTVDLQVEKLSGEQLRVRLGDKTMLMRGHQGGFREEGVKGEPHGLKLLERDRLQVHTPVEDFPMRRRSETE
jgi:hypothetical protein